MPRVGREAPRATLTHAAILLLLVFGREASQVTLSYLIVLAPLIPSCGGSGCPSPLSILWYKNFDKNMVYGRC